MNFNWVLLYPLTQTDSRYADSFGEQVEYIQGLDYDSRLDKLNACRWGDDSQEWGERLASLFLSWRKDPYPPSVAHTMEWACRFFDIDPEDYPWITVPMAASVLADLPHDNPYHNPHHFREVIILLSLLIDTHMALDQEAVKLTKDDIMMMLTAAAIHDFSHDGHGNIIDETHFPSRMEKKSFAQAKDFLALAGASHEQRDKIESMLICTDVSRAPSGRSPSGFCRDIYMAHENGTISVVRAPAELKPLIKDRALSLMAMLLCEADVGLSAGLDYEFAREMTRLVALESRVLSASPTTLKGFMDMICHGGFTTNAGNALMGENFKTIMQCVQQDQDNNVLYAQPKTEGAHTRVP